MAVDHLDVIASEGARILAAYRSNPDGRVPWSDRWTVRSVARHVAGSHHAVALILSDRPTADFEQAAAMPRIEANEPEFPSGSPPTSGGCSPSAASCHPPPSAGPPTPSSTAPARTGRGASPTTRSYTAGTPRPAPASPARPWNPTPQPTPSTKVLDVGLRVTRAMANAPAGPAIRIACTDAHQAWHLDLPEAGRLTIHTEPIDVAVTLRGKAEALLLWIWGRIDIASGEIEVDGDRSVVTRWTELLPTS